MINGTQRPDPKFVPGEKVIICTLHGEPEAHPYHGLKTEVVSALWITIPQAPDGLWCYITTIMPAMPEGIGWAEHALRPLPPSEPASWANCAFQPTREEVPA